MKIIKKGLFRKPKTWLPALFISGMLLASCGDNQKTIKKEEPEVIQAQLTDPPHVPPPITRKTPAKVIMELEVLELEKELLSGVKYTFWTFGGTVPGKFMRVREGDLVEFHLKNHPDNTVPHNIDLHAVTGPGGGATSTFTTPGHETVFTFRAINPGLYVYHCATAPVGMHIANGMYGLILVEPKEGMPEVDKEFYVMQGEFYTKGDYGDGGLQPFNMEKAIDEHADYVVFNGAVDALTGDNAVNAEVGDKVRLFVGNGGPNLTSSFHVIGEIFDKVYAEGGSMVNENVQTTSIPAGGAAITEFKTDVPGTYILVDHAIFRAFNKGALGMLNVSGKENKGIYSGQQDERIYQPEGGNVQEMPETEIEEPTAASSIQEKIALGKVVYAQNCQACHQADGEGMPGAFPPVRNSDYIQNDVDKAIQAVAHGLEGPITVNGERYNNPMPKLGLSNEKIANVMTYILNEMDNGGGEVTVEQVENVTSNAQASSGH